MHTSLARILCNLRRAAMPFRGTGTLACAQFLRRNPSDLGSRLASHP